MKKINTRVIAWIIIAVMFSAFIPATIIRVVNEKNNKNVVVSLFYNDLKNKVSETKLTEMLVEFKKAGVDTVSIMEDDINSLVARGDVINLKYHDLRHKYDEESVAMANFLGENYPQITYDTYLFILKEEAVIEKFDRIIPLKYSDYEYLRIADFEGLVIYTFLNGREAISDITVGYDETAIARLHSMGYEIALSYIPKNYSRLNYIEYLEHLVETYNIKYLNLKAASKGYDERRVVKKNYYNIADLINKYDMTLVVTEDPSQLSNQACFGYGEICRLVTTNSGTKKVLRSYETYDDTHADGKTFYEYRVQQYFNSVIDRNIRFITVTQISPFMLTYEEGAKYTLRATKEFIKDIKKQGFTINEDTIAFDYDVLTNLNSSCAVVIIIFLAYLALCLIFEIEFKKLFKILLWVALGLFVIILFIPKDFLVVIPTLYCAAAACFAITEILLYVKKVVPRMNVFWGIVTTALLLVAMLCIGMLGMCTLLSGINYYINNSIFVGIKLTLVAPIGYSVFAYYFIFIFKKDRNILKKIDVEKTLDSEIRVYWILLFMVLAFIGTTVLAVVNYYLMRSGNVDSISDFEAAMRKAITEAFPARPRTKEFILGYPCIALLVYYVKKFPNLKIVQWGFAAGAAILAASVTNTFSHVFTDASVMYMRVVNGMVLGTAFVIIAYVANLTLVRVVRILDRRFGIAEKAMKIKYISRVVDFIKTEF